MTKRSRVEIEIRRFMPSRDIDETLAEGREKLRRLSFRETLDSRSKLLARILSATGSSQDEECPIYIFIPRMRSFRIDAGDVVTLYRLFGQVDHSPRSLLQSCRKLYDPNSPGHILSGFGNRCIQPRGKVPRVKNFCETSNPIHRPGHPSWLIQPPSKRR